MFFLLRSDFAAIEHLSVQRQDMLLDVFCSTLHNVSSSLHVTCCSWDTTLPTGSPQLSGRCRGARQSPSRALPKLTLFYDHFSSRNDVFQVALVVAYADWIG